ncbi:MAG: type II toxin-antitoxin system Phd/YefM family antitoxin [Mycobacteriales bacterium]
MTQIIGQRELRNDNAAIMRRVEAGESFTVSRNGRAIADLGPHRSDPERNKPLPLAEVQAVFSRLPAMDRDQWLCGREADDAIFGADDPLQDPWVRNRSARVAQ